MEEKLDKLEKVRHSAAHLLAHALTQLYPGIKLTIGPATNTGFFYDFQYTHNFKEEDLSAIEARMHELSAHNIPLTHRQIPKEEARKIFKDNPFKLELINGIPDETVGLSEQGDFYDLCKGGHVKTTGDIKYFKLTGLSGAYWRADKKNAPLQRISGIAFLTEKDLLAYETQREDALKYDHRKLGKEMDLFSFHVEGIGFPFYHPKGQIVINQLKSFMRTVLQEHDYQEICTPTMLSDELWKRSGHWTHYKENMYFSHIDEETYAIKPMNCPGAFLVYNNRPRSYRELPLRLSEFGHVHRHELSGVLHGLMRVRAFTIDDAHIICMHEQLEQEIINGLKLVKTMLTKTGFHTMHVGLATKPTKAMGSDEIWEKATNALKNALEKNNIEYTLKPGDGAFYGPKIEIGIEDSLGRTWQTGTIQVDFFQPENFDLNYIASSGHKERPVIIHQALYGSLDRFFAILLEHHKGHLPFWLSPVQARVLPITDAHKEYAQSIADALKKIHVRVELDESAEPLSGKIRTAQLDRIPWMLVVGGKEAEAGTVTLRNPDGKQEFGIKINDLIKRAQDLNT